MRTKLRATAAVAIAAVLLGLGSHTRAGAQSEAVMSDREFARFIARANATEMREARIALERSKNDTVQHYAKMMVDDHTQAGTDLAKVAGVAPATNTDAEPALSGSGAEFDRKYMELQISEHYKELAIVQAEADRGADPIKGFANQYLTAVQRHLRMAQAVVANADRYLK